MLTTLRDVKLEDFESQDYHSIMIDKSSDVSNKGQAASRRILKKTVETLKKMKFELFWKDAQNKAAYLHINPPKLPRKRRASPRIEECLRRNAAPEFDEENVSYYRKILYETLDCLTNGITDYFDPQDFKTYIKLEKLLIKAAKGDDYYVEHDDVLSIYRKKFDGS